MATIDPFHTDIKEYSPSHREVYHDQSDCKYGKAIKREHQEKGKGGKKRCSECVRLG